MSGRFVLLSAVGAQLAVAAFASLRKKHSHEDETLPREQSPTTAPATAATLNPERTILDAIVKELTIDTAALNAIIETMVSEMKRGLEKDGSAKSTLKMLPSFVDRPRGKVSGEFFALDLGGTNFRVMKLRLKDSKVEYQSTVKFSIPKQKMEGKADELFDFIADAIKEALNTEGFKSSSSSSSSSKKKLKDALLPLGFTFSFPVEQRSLDSGILIQWTKGFSAAGAVGSDVVQLLRNALTRKGLDKFVRVSAMVNDTVGTMMTLAVDDGDCDVGLILGTGSNACYVDSVVGTRREGVGGSTLKSMILNIEWGGLGDGLSRCLPRTAVDVAIDEDSNNRGAQWFEKMISGMYLGEIARRYMVMLIDKKVLFKALTAGGDAVLPPVLREGYQFETSAMSDIAEALATGSNGALSTVLRLLQIPSAGWDDLDILRRLFGAVAQRAARLAAAGVFAIGRKIGKIDKRCDVAVDGSLFTKYPFFKYYMMSCLTELAPRHQFKAHALFALFLLVV